MVDPASQLLSGLPRLAFGMTAGRRPWLPRLAAAIEDLGYDELWANDVPGASGPDTLAAARSGASSLRLAVGVMALTEHTPEAIVDRVHALRLSLRFTLGLGSGRGRSLDFVRRGVAEIRALAPELPVALAAVGPRMAHLGGEVADVVLLNWVAPRLARERRSEIEAGARRAGRPVPRIAAYVRVAVGPGAGDRLAAVQARYAGYGESYRRVIDAQVAHGESPIGIATEEPGGVPPALDAYRSVLDTIVVRGLPEQDTLESWLAIARAATLRA